MTSLIATLVSSAPEMVREERIVTFVVKELAQLRELDRYRVAREKRRRILTEAERFRIATTPEQLAEQLGIGRFKDPQSIITLLRNKLDQQDFADWCEMAMYAQAVMSAVNEIITAVRSGNRAPSIKDLAKKTHVRYHRIAYHTKRMLMKLGLYEAWIANQHMRDIGVAKQIPCLERLLGEIGKNCKLISPKNQKRLRRILEAAAYALFAEEGGDSSGSP